jgi:two-component system, OmpR family, sensor histidine kinase VicK
MWSIQQTDPTVKVRILVPSASELGDTIINKSDKNNRIEIRCFLNSSLQTILTSLTMDKKLCLVVELKDDTKDNSYDAVGFATYSNSESIVWTYASIFETLWIQSELYSTDNQQAAV